MKVMEMLANKWATSDGCGAGDISMELIEEVAFEAGYQAAVAQIRSWPSSDEQDLQTAEYLASWLMRDEEVGG